MHIIYYLQKGLPMRVLLVAFIMSLSILPYNNMQAQGLSSFLEIAVDSDFPLENIPFGAVSLANNTSNVFTATRIGDWIVNLREAQAHGLFSGPLFNTLGRKVFQGRYLNDFMSLDRPYWVQARKTLQQLFSSTSNLKDNQEARAKVLVRAEEVVNHLAVRIGDYTDFYSSKPHAFNMGSIIRGPANAINQNWLQIPIGYHGRSSSVVVSGTPLRRPRGQTKPQGSTLPLFEDCKRLDYEIEMGAFLGGTTNQLGRPIKVNDAWNNIFGFVLLNDWSFRDFQTWQYVPLGPFTAKNGLTTISPWIVTVEALSGAQVVLPVQQPTPLPYLQEQRHVSFDIAISLDLKTQQMEKPEKLVTTNYKYMYWSCAQQLAHHSVSGCNMQPGDLLGSGTISGNDKQEWGSLFELTWGGKETVNLSNGETRKFIQDGDSINIRGVALHNGKRIGFGDCQGTVLPALPESDYF